MVTVMTSPTSTSEAVTVPSKVPIGVVSGKVTVADDIVGVFSISIETHFAQFKWDVSSIYTVIVL